MGKKVFANKMAIAAEAGSGKLIAAFPDVCNSPPSPPAGPLPVPYPNSAFSKDLKKGSKRVKIGGKPAGTEDSFFKSSPLGNEAATKSFGGSLLTHTVTGKAYFGAYSMDVCFEGKKVARHLDLMTSNHASYPGSTPPFGEMEEMAVAVLNDPAQVQCPCCWLPGCAAALPGEIAPGVAREPMSFGEFYNLDEVDPGGALTPKASARRAELAANACEGGACPNAGKDVPKSDPPCDVYRVTTAAESKKISNSLENDEKRTIREELGIPVNKNRLAQAVLGNPFATRADLLAQAGWTEERMNKAIQIDHTTPRAAGGCPTSSTNTTAHQLKCSSCKSVDGLLDTWNGQELTERRLALKI